MRNVQGHAEPYKDVVHEDAIKVSGATQAPDYSFRVGGVREFFLEAKKPSTPVKGDVGPAYQLRRYAWSARLPLSTLTDSGKRGALRPDFHGCKPWPIKIHLGLSFGALEEDEEV